MHIHLSHAALKYDCHQNFNRHRSIRQRSDLPLVRVDYAHEVRSISNSSLLLCLTAR